MFRLKPKENNSQSRYKIRLVVKDFGQRKGINFEEIFSSIVKLTSIQVVLDLTACLDLKVEQLDMKMAFFHDDLKE